MLSTLLLLPAVALACFILEPFVTYLLDAKKLRRFPNAFLFSGVSNIPIIIKKWGGFHSRDVYQAHQNHPVLRIGPNLISFSSPTAIRAIYGHSTPCLKGGSYASALSPGDHPGLIDVVDKERHASKRRILSNAFATRNLERWESKIDNKVQQLLRHFDTMLKEQERPVIDLRKWFNLFSVEAIVDIALSVQLGVVERGSAIIPMRTLEGKKQDVDYIEGIHEPNRVNHIILFTDWFKWLCWALQRCSRWYQDKAECGAGFKSLVQRLVWDRTQRWKDGEQIDDLAACLLQDKFHQARNLSGPEIEGEVATLLDAGSETTAVALTHVLYFLLKHPATLATLRAELHANVMFDSETGVPTYESLKHLPYLRACLDESLRLLPPVSTGLHRVTPPAGHFIDGSWIPGNTIVVVPIYTAHRNPHVFPEPEKFSPERWLADDSDKLHSSFIPFSTGGRGCIGRNITYIEQSILVATLVQRYNFEFLEQQWELSHEEAFVLWPRALPLKLSLRT